MPFDPPFAHLFGVPFEEFLPSLLGLGAVFAYLRLRLSWRRASRGASSSAR